LPVTDLSGWLSYAVLTFSALFVIMNPATTAFAFVSLTRGKSDEEKRLIARRACIIAFFVLTAFGLAGGMIFKIFGITLEAFRIAGGILLFGIGMGMLRGSSESQDDAGRSRTPKDVAVVPLAIPFISGPGAIATTMILMSEAPTIWHTIIVFVGITTVILVTKYALRYASNLVRILGNYGMTVVTKIFGLILLVIAIQFIINGIRDALPYVVETIAPVMVGA